ncbi:hypothetical protein Tco_1440209 [Tanacetum coccineum]
MDVFAILASISVMCCQCISNALFDQFLKLGISHRGSGGGNTHHGHFAKECRKSKRVKDYQYHKEKMMLCKKEARGVSAKIQEVLTLDFGPTYDAGPLEKVQLDDYNVFANEYEHNDQPKDMNDTSLMEKVDNNKIPDSSNMCNNEFEDDQKANATLTHELNECKYTLEESNDIRDRCKSALHQQEIELERYKVYKNCQLEKEEVPYDKDDLTNIFAPNCEETLLLEDESRSKLDKELIKNTVDMDWQKRLDNIWKQPITHEITVLVKNLLMPLAAKTKLNANEIERTLKEEMKDILCVCLISLVDSLNYYDIGCKYLDKIKECECLEFKLSKQNKFVKNKPTNLSNHSLESKNTSLKKIIAKFHKDFSKLEAHCVALELKNQNQALQSGQHGRVLKGIDEIETINIELEHSVATLLQQNEILHKEKEHLK